MLLVQPKEKASDSSVLSFLKQTIGGMEISINGEKTKVAETTALESIINERLGDRRNGVAVAVNQTVIPKVSWREYLVQPDDDILIIKATQGG